MNWRAVSSVLLLAILVQSYCMGVGCLVCSFGPGHSQSHQIPTTPDDSMDGMNHDDRGMSHEDHDPAMTGVPDGAFSFLSVTTANCGASPTCNAVLSSSGVEQLRLETLAGFATTVANGAFDGTDLLGTVARRDSGPPARSLSSQSAFSVLRI